MLSVLVFDADEPMDLTITLSSLVAGVVEGVLREVVVVEPQGEAALKVADHAGCSVLSRAELGHTPLALKGDWLILMRAGDRLPANWPERAARHGEDQSRAKGPRGGRFVLPTREARGWRRWLAPRQSAYLVPKAHAMSRLSAGAPWQGVAKGIGLDRLADREA